MANAIKAPLEACDLRLVRGVLDDICAAKQIHVGSPEAQHIARQIIELWHGGVRTVDDFKSIIDALSNPSSD